MRRRLHRWAAWLLPLLVVRLFVPTGFMLSASGGEIGIALCPGYAPLPFDHAAHGMHGGAHEPDGPQPSGESDSGPTPCPFLLAGSAASAPPTKLLGELPRVADPVPDLHSHPDWISRPVLIDRIRGPPVA
jgi:hypothetical protein